MKNQKSWICLFALFGSFPCYSIAAKNPKPKGSSDYMFNAVDAQFPDIHPDIMEDTLLPTVGLLLILMNNNVVQ